MRHWRTAAWPPLSDDTANLCNMLLMLFLVRTALFPGQGITWRRRPYFSS
jgi:hypothetical protein